MFFFATNVITGNTLDQIYDEGVNPDDGRQIKADRGSLEITASGNRYLEGIPDVNHIGIYVNSITAADQTSIYGED
ncbi:MAG: hypothetical protein HRT68_05300 [Flavobacteriaceae bacterium]|nr:hypothetical protein [Flavobacteriaceae bacterium]